MTFRKMLSDFARNLSGCHLLVPAALAALCLLAAPLPMRADKPKCPPCSSDDANACAFACCLFQNCSSPAGPACVSFCALGWLAWEIFGDGEVGPAFKSFSGQREADCHGDNKVGVIMLPPVGSRNTTKRVEVGLVSISDRKFLSTPEEVVSVVVEVAGMQEYKDSQAMPRWKTIGLAAFDSRAGAWVVDWHLSSYDLTEYVLKARSTRKNGRVQEARAVALTGSASH